MTWLKCILVWGRFVGRCREALQVHQGRAGVGFVSLRLIAVVGLLVSGAFGALAATAVETASAREDATRAASVSPELIAARNKVFGASYVDQATGAVDPRYVILDWNG